MTGLRPLALLLCLTVGAFGKEPRVKLAGIQSVPEDFVLAGKWASQRSVILPSLR